MPSRLVEPYLKFPKPAFRRVRLVDFATGSANLQREHEGWLTGAARSIPPDRNFHVYIIGYASKLAFHGTSYPQSDAANVGLSFRRANTVARLMELVNPRVTTRVDQFEAHGNHDYFADAADNSALWRAVEVHVFLDEAPPPPPHVDPPPPCPGGQRFRKWSIATPGGASVSPGPIPVAVAGNLVVLRRDEGAPVIHWYFAPATGVGWSFSGPKLKALIELLKKIFSNFSVSGMSWTSFSAETAFNFKDLEGATCNISSAGGGVGPGYQAAIVSVNGQIWFREPGGKCMFSRKDFFNRVDVSGPDLQLGVGGSSVGGPLIRVD
jgi:hypothetical protein